MLNGRYDAATDMWSCGVVMYTIVLGVPPFAGSVENEVLDSIRSGCFRTDVPGWDTLSDDAKDVLEKMLEHDPKKRISPRVALEHKWMSSAPKNEATAIQQSTIANMRQFRAANRLKRAALHTIAQQLDDSHLRGLRELFVSLDRDGDGSLTAAELQEGFLKAGLEHVPSDLIELMEGMDSDGSGRIDYTEFLAAAMDKRMYITEEFCWMAFRVFDISGTGRISKEELAQVLMPDETDAMADRMAGEIMKQIDTMGDGVIDFPEFFAMMRSDR